MIDRAPDLSPLAEHVRHGDPDRFAASLFAPQDTREPLYTLYAFNLELARTAWKVSEPQIGVIRLRWWRDVIEEIFEGRPPRAHELVTPLARLIRETRVDAPPPRAAFEALIDARLRDLDPAPMAARAEFDAYVNDTSGALLRLAAWTLSGGRETPAMIDAARDAGYAYGVASLFRATPELAARGRLMLPPLDGDGPIDLNAVMSGETPEGLRRSVRRLARHAIDRLTLARSRRSELPPRATPAFLAGWRSDAILTAASRADLDVFRDFGPESEFRRRAGLLWRGWTGRW